MLDVETAYYDRLLDRHLEGVGYSVRPDSDRLFKDLKRFLLIYDEGDSFLGCPFHHWAEMVINYCPYEVIEKFESLEEAMYYGHEIFLSEVMMAHAKEKLYDYFDKLYSPIYVDDITDEMWEYAIKEY